jgi:hypothetical protein
VQTQRADPMCRPDVQTQCDGGLSAKHRGIAFSVVEMSFPRGWKWTVGRAERSWSASAPRGRMRYDRPKPLSMPWSIGPHRSGLVRPLRHLPSRARVRFFGSVDPAVWSRVDLGRIKADGQAIALRRSRSRLGIIAKANTYWVVSGSYAYATEKLRDSVASTIFISRLAR